MEGNTARALRAFTPRLGPDDDDRRRSRAPMVPEATAEQELLAVAKLSAARDVIASVLQGRLDGTPTLIEALAGLVVAAGHHAKAARA